MDITLFKTKNALLFKKIASRNDLDKLKEDQIKELAGFLIESDEKEIRRVVETLRAKKEKKLIAVLGKDDEFNRRIIETCRIDLLVLNNRNKKDTLKQRDSGLNHVVAKEAKKRNISLIINISELNLENKRERATILARMMQNIVVCRKTKTDIKIVTLAETEKEIKDEYQLKSFLFSIGASSEQASKATEFNY